MQLDVADDLLKKATDALMSYRNTGFSDALTTAETMCNEMNTEAELKQKWLRTKKEPWPLVSRWTHWGCTLKNGTTFFNVLVDIAFSSINENIWTLERWQIWTAPQLSKHKKEVLKHCQTLSTLKPALAHDGQADFDGTELAMYMYNFPPLPSENMTNLDLLTFLHEMKLTVMYPNMWVTLSIFAALPVTVAAA